jgi:RNA polymerase sigma factor (sigma-70 family)
MQQSQNSVSARLIERRAQFKAFLVSRLGNDADAEDVLQNGLVKALEHATELQDDTKLVPWFYQVLRRSIIDHVRSRHSAVARDQRWTEDMTALAPEDERAICGCVNSLMDDLKPRQAALIRRVDLEGESVADAASLLGMTPNSASVALHRARAELRERLEDFCRDCAKGDCLNCDCPPAQPSRVE